LLLLVNAAGLAANSNFIVFVLQWILIDKYMAFFILPLLSARDLDIGPVGRYQARADDKVNMKKAMY
jgi:hypothetical protein